MIVSTLVLGLMLGSTYALIALGLTIQYGIARIMNLAYGEIVIAASFAAFVLFSSSNINPILALALVLPGGFLCSYLIYVLVLQRMVNRAENRGALEANSILVTFGLLFIIQGTMLVFFGGDYTSYSYLNTPISILGVTVALNRVLASVLVFFIAGVLYYLLTYTRWGTTFRAVAVRPENAALVGVDVNKVAAVAFALGGALAAAAGVIISMYQTFSAADGVVFTMKALIVVIMGGVGNLLGALIAGLILGVVETFVSTYADPGLTLAATYIIFLALLLWRPSGIFSKGRS